ncbi:hypothetical protein GT022_17665 [Agaribacter marinus]|uniref:Phage tail family protein n=1 Tax=Virgibacillus salarius TaxID=447199 RepID=A0A941DW80_9BACI|nr:phage tail domain-containing protein [Virgibacillus salarius]MBR7797860.1 phage tail family protein [Virgibacillus salarius]NAZ10570.1 hypothetical protein [Agaribacter marinus]
MRWIEIAQKYEVNVQGSVEAYPIITAVTQKEIPYIKLSVGNAALKLHYPFKKNDTVKVDFDKRKVFINDELQMTSVDLTDADFFPLTPGLNEIQTVPAMQLEVKYRERWL